MADGNKRTPPQVPARPKGSRLQRFVRWVGILVGTGFVAVTAVGVGTYLYYAPTVPTFNAIGDYQPKIGTRIYSADNQLIGEFAEERRVLVPVERIPPQLFNAFIAAEDKRFRSHLGIDFLGVSQAIVDKILHPRSKLRGASTISQQVAKSLLATRESYETATERSLVRKIREAILAWRLERTLSKDDIIYMYVTQIFLGHKAYGVQAAAEHYFRKNVWELHLAEMATLAGLPQRPSDYSPFSRPGAADARRRYVLRRMLDEGYITKAEHDEAVAYQLKVYPRHELYLQVAPYFTEEVRRRLVERYGERAILEDGLQVYTTINIEQQNFAQRAITQGLKELDRRQGFRGPLAKLPKPKRPVFKAMYRQQLGLKDGEELTYEDDALYLAQVTGFGAERKVANIDIAGQEAILPLAGMVWARKPNPMERVESHLIHHVTDALQVGDVVAVRKTTRAYLAEQKYASDVINTVPKDKDDVLFRLDQEPIAQGSLMSVDSDTGYVVAQVGGYNFEESSFNRATQACREPGSAFKPIVYSAAIDKLDYTASTLIDDKPMVFDDEQAENRWKPNNAGMEFRGALPMRTCLMDSINTPAIRIAEAVGIVDLMKNAENLGITTPLKRELGIALGSSCTTLSDLMNVYTTLDNYGKRRPLIFIRRVLDRYGNVLEEHSDPADPAIELATRFDRGYAKLVTPRFEALDKQSAFLTVSLMQNVVEGGTGIGASRLGVEIAGKTGTTDDSFDAWFMGFTPEVITGVWVGHDQKERPLGVNEQGGRTALPIWVDFMDRALRDYTNTKVKPPPRINHGYFAPPVGVVRASIDPETGLLARPDSSRRVSEWYRAGSEPTEYTPNREVFDPEHFDPYEVDPG